MSIEEEVHRYCDEYDVPQEYLFEILEDSKVVPMIRGKASEYNAYLFMKEHLDSHVWDVQKLNLNAQNNMNDEDVSLTHRKTGYRLKCEVKNACRGSFNTGKRTKILKVPHFKVKCHRSRSNMKKADSTNDRYVLGDFDLLISNTANALYQEGTVTDGLEIINDKDMLDVLYDYYHVCNKKELVKACNSDWRFAIPKDIADEDGVIPRTPYVALKDDANWTTIDKISDRLEKFVSEQVKLYRKGYRR